LDPAEATAQANEQIVMSLFDRLTSLAPDQTVRPGLATDWSVSPDGLTWTFRLRRGAQFHDGQPVDAEAVKFTFDRFLDENKPLKGRALLAPVIKSVRVMDEVAIEMTIHQPFAPLANLLATAAPSIVSPKAVRELGDDFGRRPVGSGPFVFQQWESARRLVIRRNDRYWGTPAKPQQVIFLPVPEGGTRVAMLETGEVDIAAHVASSEMKRLRSNPQIQPLEADALEAPMVKLVMLDELFKDVRVRQAMNYAVNVPEIIDAVLDGAGTFTGAPLPKSIPGALQKSKYHYDPALAKKLLAEAGYPNGFKTILIAHADTGAGTREMLEALQGQWRAVGIDVTLNILAQAGASRIRALPPEQAQEKQTMLTGPSAKFPDPHSILYYHFHSSVWSPKGSNQGFYKNARVDELLERGAGETDPTKRTAIYREVQEILIEDAPAVFLYTSRYVYAARTNLKDVLLLPTQIIPFAEVSKS
jgi:peptide/nickel transport system substrate-binding protein